MKRTKKKKVLIISKEQFESSTEKVMDWIHHLGHEYYRLNGDAFEQVEKDIVISSEKNVEVLINDLVMPKRFYSIWYRRWSDYKSMEKIVDLSNQLKVNAYLAKTLSDCVAQNAISVKDIVLNTFKYKKYLSTQEQLNVNKVNVLAQAKKIGLKVPNTLLASRKSSIISFLKKNEKAVIKDMEAIFYFQDNGKRYLSYVDLLDEEKLSQIPEEFPLSFIQEFVEKEYEIRAFILGKKIYSMAIFSQSDATTKIDFRRYNAINPSRKVPYKLPTNIENKLQKLMNALNLYTGSVDILKSNDGSYYFLEVNPVGQFGMVSEPCNYNVELEIAKYLIN